MTSLWIYLIFLSLAALLFIVVPVWRYRTREFLEDLEIRRQKNIDIFNQSMRDLEQEYKDGRIEEEQYTKLKNELERTFINDMEEFDRERRRKRPASSIGGAQKLLPLALAVLIPVGAILLYQNQGAGGDLVLPELFERMRAAQTEEDQEEALTELAEYLQRRFERNPRDLQNGYMLGTLYLRLERYDAAVDTFNALTDVVERDEDKAAVYGQLAQSLYLASGQRITAEVQRAMDEALEANPNEYATMSLLAIEAFVNEDYAAAVDYWRRQLSQVTPGSREARNLEDRISRVSQLVPEEELADMEEEGPAPEAAVRVRVEVDPSIRENLDQSLRVFVFAREAGGRPFPLAAEDLTVADLPATVTLDDSKSMMPQATLSSAENVYVGATISFRGEAVAQSGDYQALSEPFELAAQDEPVNLVIKDRVE